MAEKKFFDEYHLQLPEIIENSAFEKVGIGTFIKRYPNGIFSIQEYSGDCTREFCELEGIATALSLLRSKNIELEHFIPFHLNNREQGLIVLANPNNPELGE